MSGVGFANQSSATEKKRMAFMSMNPSEFTRKTTQQKLLWAWKEPKQRNTELINQSVKEGQRPMLHSKSSTSPL